MKISPIQVLIKKQPSFVEEWTEGSVLFEQKEHKFWIINPKGKDEEGREYEVELRWWFKQVPREVRNSSEGIINMFKDRT